MPISSPQVFYGLVANSTPGSLHVSNSNTLGTQQTQAPLTGATIFYSVGMSIADGQSLVWNSATGAITGTDVGVSQVETFTVVAAAGCTSNGTCNVVVTGALLTGSPITVPAALTTATHTTATLIRTAITTAINANAVIAAIYTIGGSSANGTLTDLSKRNSDLTLNVAIPAGLGITAAPSSANTTAGRIPSLAYRLTDDSGTPIAWDQKDNEGRALTAATKLYGILPKVTSGKIAIADATPVHKLTMLSGTGDVGFDPLGTHAWSALAVTFTATGDTVLSFDVSAG